LLQRLHDQNEPIESVVNDGDTVENSFKGTTPGTEDNDQDYQGKFEEDQDDVIVPRQDWGQVEGDVDDNMSNPAGKQSITSTHNFVRGEKVQCTFLKYGPLGVSVRLTRPGVKSPELQDEEEHAFGLVLQDEVNYWFLLHNREPKIGESCTAYVLRPREDGKLDVSLRAIGFEKVSAAKEQLLARLEQVGMWL
jgi:hypothetical protein